MLVAAGNKKGNRLRGVYTWSYLIASVKSRAARHLVSSNALCDKFGVPNAFALSTKAAHPPSAPPSYDI
jgi:hypothetical protein